MEVVFANDQVYDFLQSFEGEFLGRVNKSLELLQQHGHKIRYPHSKCVAPSIFELRLLGNINLRIFFAFHKHKAVVLHSFIKKTQKIPKHELSYVMKIHSQL